jgi:hypothetical protein
MFFRRIKLRIMSRYTLCKSANLLEYHVYGTIKHKIMWKNSGLINIYVTMLNDYGLMLNWVL